MGTDGNGGYGREQMGTDGNRWELMDTEKNCDFPCFYIDISSLSLNLNKFELYFHGADNWNMNYRHHDILYFKQINAWIHQKKTLIRSVIHSPSMRETTP